MIPLGAIRAIVIAAAALACVGVGVVLAAKHYAPIVKRIQSEFDTFKGGVEALGKAAQKRADAQKIADQTRKEAADAENAAAVARLNGTIARMRRDADRARPSSLPPAPATSSRPDLICLDRAEYQREDGEIVGRLRAGARSLADEGAAATVDLDTAKRWAVR